MFGSNTENFQNIVNFGLVCEGTIKCFFFLMRKGSETTRFCKNSFMHERYNRLCRTITCYCHICGVQYLVSRLTAKREIYKMSISNNRFCILHLEIKSRVLRCGANVSHLYIDG